VAGGFWRGEIGRRLRLRHAPRLEFLIDDTADKAAASDRASSTAPLRAIRQRRQLLLMRTRRRCRPDGYPDAEKP